MLVRLRTCAKGSCVPYMPYVRIGVSCCLRIASDYYKFYICTEFNCLFAVLFLNIFFYISVLLLCTFNWKKYFSTYNTLGRKISFSYLNFILLNGIIPFPFSFPQKAYIVTHYYWSLLSPQVFLLIIFWYNYI